ncbi:hypothetical protein WN943_011263 [Citrus x changshan-huyou]
MQVWVTGKSLRGIHLAIGNQDFRKIEVVIRENKPFQMEKLKEAAARVDRTIEATACEIKPDHMTSVFVAFDAVT